VGRFAQFALAEYLQVEGVRLVAIADADAATAIDVAGVLRVPALGVEELLEHPDIDLVYLGTPPASHASHARRALAAGKHVLVEKPLATSVAEAGELVELARRTGRVLAVNHMLRHDPLCLAVGRILDEGLLGAPLHASFENLAQDEELGPAHWFWDPARSGGMFVEHAVHFFDLFASWLGAGEVVSAEQVLRPGAPAPLVEQVGCTARHGDGVHVQQYHGFHQPQRMDRQLLRIVCERGDLQLHEWVPTSLEVHCLADAETLARLEQILRPTRLERLAAYDGSDREVRARHREHRADGRYLLHASAGMPKWSLYAQLVRALFTDQLAAIRDPGHQPLVTAEQGLAAVVMAERAQELATRTTWTGPA
jgi:predicted dehydrogenase